MRHHTIPNAAAQAVLRDLEEVTVAFMRTYDRFLEAKTRLPSIVQGKLFNAFPRQAAKAVTVEFLDHYATHRRVTITVRLAPLKQYVDGPFSVVFSRTKSFKEEVSRDI